MNDERNEREIEALKALAPLLAELAKKEKP
jgi:hypothetical protein